MQAILGQFCPQLTEEERLCGWFQQDSATAHTAHSRLFPVSSGTELSAVVLGSTFIRCNPCGFFFWGCLKDKVYNSNSGTEELTGNIYREMANIPAEPLVPV
jgi:hypothetical protein